MASDLASSHPLITQTPVVLSAPIEGSSRRAPSPARSTGSTASLSRPPRSPLRPIPSPISASSVLSSPSPTHAEMPARPAPLVRTGSSNSVASRSSQTHVPPAMLPSHPSLLPKMYDSTASTTEDDDADSERDYDEETMASEAGIALMLERRKREEARAAGRRRSRGTAGRGKGAKGGHEGGAMYGVGAAAEGRVAGEAGSARMPTVDGRHGLGFALAGMEEPLPDYAAARRRSSAAPLPPSLSNSPRMPTRQFAVTHDAAITLSEETEPAHRRSPRQRHRVHFDQPYRPPGRDRSGSNNSHVALQPEHIVFPDALPQAPPASHTRPASISSRRSSAASVPTLPQKKGASPEIPFKTPEAPRSPRARSPRRSNGPSTLMGDVIAQRPASRLYFPAAPPKAVSVHSLETRSPTPSDASPVSIVFPSRPQPKPPQASLSPRPPSSKLFFPSPTPSHASSPVFPPRATHPPERGSQPFPARKADSSNASSPFLSLSPASSHSRAFSSLPPSSPFPPPPADSPHARYITQSPSSPAISVPVVSAFPPPVTNLTLAEPASASLDDRLGSNNVKSARPASKRMSSATWDLPPALSQSRNPGADEDELDRMMRALARGSETDDVKKREARRKSIHAQLLKQSASSPSASSPSLSVPDSPRTPRSPQEEAFDRALFDGNTLRKSLGATLLSEDAPSRRSSATPTLRPGQVDTLVGDDGLRPLEFAESYDPPVIANGLAGSVSETSSEVSSLPSFPDVPTTSYLPDYPFAGRSAVINAPPIALRPADDAVEALAFARQRRAPHVSAFTDNRLSIASESGQSQYHDAEDDSIPVSFHEVPVAPVALASADGSDDADGRENTREWIMETLATGIVQGAAGRTLGDIAEADEEEIRRRSREPSSHSAYRTPPTSSTPVFPSPLRSIGSNGRSRDISPVPSIRSNASSAAVSYTAPTRISSGQSKSKFALGKKLGSFFSANSSSSSLPLRTSGGISSQDIVLGESLFDVDGSSAARHIPSDSAVEVLVTSPEGTNAHPSDPLQKGDAGTLEDLLNRFKEEEKERLRTIAAARSRVVSAESSVDAGMPIAA
ncbi:Proteophosphoglycan ppg4 [Rhodotorula toruloides]|nr:Proteophosphoglycan ppg4 [Rhodotorula toruloides]